MFDNVASFGRPLGDKSVLYKYLNPHLMVVTSYQASNQIGKVEVVDSISGDIAYSAEVQSIGPIKAKMVENWLVFFWKEMDGWRVGSVELYEGVNDIEKGEKTGKTPGISSSSKGKIISKEKSFYIGAGIREFGFSTSKFGITSKELICQYCLSILTDITNRD